MMRHTYRILSAVVLTLAVTACRMGDDPDEGLVLELRSNTLTIAPGDAASFTLVLRNLGHREAAVQTPHCPHYFTAVDAAGRVAGPPVTICATILLGPTTLAPGDSLVAHDYWAADSGTTYEKSTLRVAPGSYRITASLPTLHRLVHSQPLVLQVQ